MLDSLIKATLLLSTVAVACYALRRQSAALRHLLWAFGIASLIAIPVVSRWSPLELPILPGWQKAIAPDVTVAPAPLNDEESSSVMSSSQASDEVASANDVHQTQPVAADVPATKMKWTALNVLLAIWAAGAVLMLASFTTGLIAVRRIVGRASDIADESWHRAARRAAHSIGLPVPPQLKESIEIDMPFACGIVRPVIVIPASAAEWSTEHRHAVLMHELAHVSRGDLMMNAVSHLVRAFYWFHPLAWWAAYRLRVESERACDDVVLRAGALPSNYAEQLLNIVQTVGRGVPAVALAMARRSDFEGRLLAILEPGIPRTQLGRLRVAVLSTVFGVAVTSLAALAPARVSAMPSVVQVIAATERQAAPNTLNALIETLSDANTGVRLAAVNSLAQLQDPRAITALSKALREDADARVRAAAAHALGELDDSRAVPALLAALRSERIAAVREQIVHALAEIDDQSAVAGISAIVRDPSAKVRREVARALGELDDPAATTALISMARDEDVEVRAHVANALGELEDAAGLDALVALSRDASAEVRAEAVSSLGELHDRRALDALIAALKDSEPDVRSQAADAIDDLEDLRQAPAALIQALSDPNRDVRKSVASALGSIEDPAAVPGLRRLVSDVDAEVRRAAAEALSDIGGAEAIQALVALLKDADPEIRRIAAEALGSKRR